MNTLCKPTRTAGQLPFHTGIGGGVQWGLLSAEVLKIVCGNSFKAAEVIKIYSLLPSCSSTQTSPKWKQCIINIPGPPLRTRGGSLHTCGQWGQREEPHAVSSPRPCEKSKPCNQLHPSIANWEAGRYTLNFMLLVFFCFSLLSFKKKKDFICILLIWGCWNVKTGIRKERIFFLKA
jgi:hypothetical protein